MQNTFCCWTQMLRPVWYSVVAMMAVMGLERVEGATTTSSPVEITVTAPADLPVVTVVATDSVASEVLDSNGATNTATFTISRTGSTNSELMVYYRMEGTASNSVDYAHLPGYVNIPKGRSSTSVTISPRKDTLVEGTETVTLRLIVPDVVITIYPPPLPPYKLGDRSSATATILDKDSTNLPVTTVVATDPWAAEEGQDPGVFTISRSGSTGASLTVYYSLTGTATSGDYLSLPGSLTIPSGASSAKVQVVPHDGSTPEPDETVILNLLPRELYRVGYPSNAVVTIKDNDSPTNSLATLTITSPTNGATFIAPATIKIDATAIDPAGYISKVDFYANTNKIGESQIWFFRAPDPGTPIYHSFVWTNAPGTSTAAGEQVLTARAADSHNLTVVSKPVHVTFEYVSKTPVITVVASDAEAAEKASQLGVTNTGAFTIRRDGNTNDALTVMCSIGGTATKGVDYVALPNSISLPAGVRSTSLIVQPLDDSLVEGNETVILTILPDPSMSPVARYLVGSPSNAVVTIIDNEEPTNRPPVVTLLSPTNGSSFTYPSSILLSAHAVDPESGGVSLVEFYEGTNRLARLTNHWMGLIIPGQTHPPSPYFVDFQFVWTNPPPGQYRLMARAIDSKEARTDSSPAYITVEPANSMPIVRVLASIPTVTEGLTNTGKFTLLRDGNTNIALLVSFTLSGSAVNGVDYKRLDTNISLASGVRSADIVVQPLADNLIEGNETVVLTLLPNQYVNMLPYLIGSPSNATVTILDLPSTNTPLAERRLPASYSAGQNFSVEIQITPRISTTAYAVEDQPPAGWVVSNIKHDGVFDSLTGKVKWGPFFDSLARTLTYDVTPPSGAIKTYDFAGLFSADGVTQTITGDRAISSVPKYHPADRSPTNYVLSITELTAYGSAWRTGAQWPLGPNPIPITYVTRAGALWKGGESYRLDLNAGDPPNCWVTANSSIHPTSVMGMNAMARPMAMNENTAVSTLATNFVPGVPFIVTLTVTPAADTTVYAVEDQPPAGWSVSLINEGGVYDSVNQKVKWVFLDKTPRTLTYQVTPMDCAPGTRLTFNGTASFDSLLGGPTMAIAGLRSPSFDTGNGPRIAGINRQSATEVLLTVQGVPGQLHAVQTSSDLREWATLLELTPTEIKFQFRDANAMPDHRFYRVILK